MLVDTHCHLDDERGYPGGASGALDRAQQAGVGLFVVVGVGETLAPATDAIALARRHKDIVATVGVHPHDARLFMDVVSNGRGRAPRPGGRRRR
ncbi:MAG: TatD family hydrolase [Polyangiaceae bacterium]